MMNLPALIASVFLAFNVASGSAVPSQKILGSREFSLNDRYKVASVNEVFKKNILLNMAYLRGSVTQKKDIDWATVESPFTYSFTLRQGESFAFHDSVLPEYQGKVVKTTNAHFNSTEGFVSDGYLVGDGVCHLASLINWAAQDAGLTILVTKNHDFAKIEEVPKEYGVSIYVSPTTGAGTRNNLYITNNQNQDVTFSFSFDGTELKVDVIASK
ncbi:MAG TPA: VanW family protein [Patescibacteria group bacterium]|nr:VanW family protein [Patescibacteria group bacterium]